VPALQTSGQIAGWLRWRGFPIASPAVRAIADASYAKGRAGTEPRHVPYELRRSREARQVARDAEQT
jgi:hypothetical protein